MAGVVLEYEKIIGAIGNEIQAVWNDLIADSSTSELISNIKSIEVSDEQLFRKQEENRTLKRGTIYLVVRFSAGAINYGSTVTPISIYGLGTANQVKPVQLLLSVFASKWTTLSLAKGLISADGENLEVEHTVQVWNTPEVISNFNNVDDDFRNLYRVTGSVLVGPSAISIGTLEYYYTTNEESEFNFTEEDFTAGTTHFILNAKSDIVPESVLGYDIDIVSYSVETSLVMLNSSLTFNESEHKFVFNSLATLKGKGKITVIYKVNGIEKVNIMAFRDNYSASLDSQPFGNTNGFVKSEVNFSTYTFSISTYLLNNHLSRDMLAIRGFRYRPNGTYSSLTSNFQPNDYVKIKITFSNEYNNIIGSGEETSTTDLVKGDDFYGYFKVTNSSIDQPIGNIPTISISLAR